MLQTRPGRIRRESLPVGRKACPGGPPVCLPVFFIYLTYGSEKMAVRINLV